MVKKRIVHFINSDPSKVIRAPFAAAGYSVTFLATRSHTLSRRSFIDFFDGNFKNASRRSGWFARKFIGFKLFFPDYEFNFTEDLTKEELFQIEKLLKRMLEKKPENINLKADLLSVYCYQVKMNEGKFADFQKPIKCLCDEIIEYALSHLKTLPDSVPRAQKPLPIDNKLAHEALFNFNRHFPSEKWRWYLVSGTFLGMIREGAILKNDYDLDIGFNAEDFDLELFLENLNSMEDMYCRKVDYQKSYRFRKNKILGSAENLTVLKLVYKKTINLDLFIHHLQDDIRWHGSSFHRWENKEFELETYSFLGLEVRGAKDFDLYLTENYGDWRTPASNFEFTTGTPNLKMVKNFDSIPIFFRRLALMESVDKTKALLHIMRNSGFIDAENRFQFGNSL